MPLLEMFNISKSFPGVQALDSVRLSVDAGGIYAIIGENGAGKSTLIKILAGVHPAGTFTGELFIAGNRARFTSVADAEAAGVAVIYQELSLVDELSVAENIVLGHEPSRFGVIDWGEMHRRAAAALAQVKLAIDPSTPVGPLGVGQKQLVEIAKAISRQARLLILDEPTAALTDAETQTLFEILLDLKARGVGIIYISHKLDEVLSLSGRITVLRDGRVAAQLNTSVADRAELIRAMVGRELTEVFTSVDRVPGDVVLRVSGLCIRNVGTTDVDDVSFEVRSGEILGVAGLMGSGRTELLTAIFGAWAGPVEGGIEIEGRAVRILGPREAIRCGIALVTEDRQRYGLVPERSVTENITLAALRRIAGRILTNRRAETDAAVGTIEQLHIRTASPQTPVNTLSGGNQQKVVLGKWLLTRPRVLLLDEPTRGIDVGAKQEIYREVQELAAEGMAIVLVSSELPEVLGLSDRVLVMRAGQVACEFKRAEATAEKVMAAATSASGGKR